MAAGIEPDIVIHLDPGVTTTSASRRALRELIAADTNLGPRHDFSTGPFLGTDEQQARERRMLEDGFEGFPMPSGWDGPLDREGD